METVSFWAAYAWQWVVENRSTVGAVSVMLFGVVLALWTRRKYLDQVAADMNEAHLKCKHGQNKFTRNCKKCAREFEEDAHPMLYTTTPTKGGPIRMDYLKAKNLLDERQFFDLIQGKVPIVTIEPVDGTHLKVAVPKNFVVVVAEEKHYTVREGHRGEEDFVIDTHFVLRKKV